MDYVTNNGKITCIHGGEVSLATVKDRGIQIENGLPVLKEDIEKATITGCSFTNNPCVKVNKILSGYAPNVMFGNDQVLTSKMKGLSNAGAEISVKDVGY